MDGVRGSSGMLTVMPNDLPIVVVDVADTQAMTAWATAATSVFLSPRPTADGVAERQRRMRDHRLFAAKDGEQTVATFRSFDSTVTLPGQVDPLPANAISSVTVLPTHRRRGLLTRWMTDELGRARDAGQAVSILIASEAPIYRRFGFGVATTACTWTIDTLRAAWLPPRTGSMEIVMPERFADAAGEIYDQARRRSPGAIDRSSQRWRMLAQVEPGPDPEDRKRMFAFHRNESGDLDGLLVYKIEDNYTDRVAAAVLHVHDMWACTDAAYADLWRFCAEVDFVAKVVAEDRSPFESLPMLLTDPRAARDGAVSDFLWVRLHDVPTAFSARRYAVPGRLSVQVHDALGHVGGRYLLEVKDDGAGVCTPDDDPAAPDLELDAATLAELWLGSGHAGVLAAAGRLHARDAETLGRAHAMLSWPVPAWCGTWF